MIDPPGRAAPGRKRPRVFYGWWIVVASVATNSIMSAAYFQGFNAMILPIEEEFGWKRTVLSGAGALRQIEMGIASPLVGFLLVRYSPRQLLIASGLITGLGLIWLGNVGHLVTFYLAFFVVSLGASGASHAVTWPVLIARWFRRRRGLAMGLAVMGPIFGSPFVILNTSIEQEYGWRAVFIGYGVIVAIGVTLLAMLARNYPEDHGLRPDGDPPEEDDDGGGDNDGAGRRRRQPDVGLSLRTVLHTKEFWLLTAYMGGMFVVNSAMQLHQIPYFQNDRGMSAPQAATTLTLVFVISAIGRIGGGYLMDRSDYRLVLATMAVIMGLALVYLQVVEPTSILATMPYVVMFGVGFGSMIPIRGTLGSLMFGLRSLGPVIGLLQGGAVAAGVVGPIFLGAMFDFDGNYTRAIWALVGVSFLMAPLAFLMSAPTYLRERQATMTAS